MSGVSRWERGDTRRRVGERLVVAICVDLGRGEAPPRRGRAHRLAAWGRGELDTPHPAAGHAYGRVHGR